MVQDKRILSKSDMRLTKFSLQLIPGLGFFKTAYQRQTMYFGHMRGSTYSVLIIDNRGMGGSSKPLMRYSTSEMAQDILEVANHLGWTSPRQLHVCGISMGGMIAQELACAAPERVSSLSLISTAAKIENTTTFTENMVNRITMLLPKSPDRSIQYAARASMYNSSPSPYFSQVRLLR